MNQTNGDSKTEITVTGLSVEKVVEEKENTGVYTFKVIDGGKISEPIIENEMVLAVAENGRLNENNTLETSRGNIVKFAGYSKIVKNKQEKLTAIQQYKKLKQEKARRSSQEDNSRVG